jgi:putative peptidoglycan lipid II flippase
MLVTENLAEDTFIVTVGLTRLMLTGVGFFALAIITGLTLNSYKRFLLAVMDDVVFKVAGLVGLVVLGRYIGIYGLAWGIALGSWVAPFLHLIGLRKHLGHYRFRADMRSAPFRKMMRLIRPLIVGTVCIEGRRLIDNRFASNYSGSVSALAYGYKLIEFAYVFLAEPLAVVILPYFSELGVNKEHHTLGNTLFTSLRTVILMFTPMGVCLFMLRYPVVRLLFERGEFDDASTQLTVVALAYYAFGIVSFAVELLLVRTFFSLSDTLTPAILEVLTLSMHVGFIVWFQGSLQHGAIALAFTLSKTLKAAILYVLLKRRLGILQFSENMRFFGKILLAASLMIGSMWGYQAWFAARFTIDSLVPQAAMIVTGGAIGTGIYLAVAFWLRVEELQLLWQALTTYLHSKMRRSHEESN